MRHRNPKKYVRKNTSRKGAKKRTTRKAPVRAKGKARPRKVRGKQPLRAVRKSKGNRIQKTRRRPNQRQKPLARVANKAKVSIPSARRRRGSTRKTKAVSPQTQLTVRHSRKEEKIKLVFTGSKANRRKATGKGIAKAVEKQVRAQLKRKDGRPPKGFLIVITDEDGNTLTYITPPDMVVNQKNINKFIAAKMKDARETPTKKQEYKSGEGDSMTMEEAMQIDFKFIYGTDPGE